jgi:hypothetical protein
MTPVAGRLQVMRGVESLFAPIVLRREERIEVRVEPLAGDAGQQRQFHREHCSHLVAGCSAQTKALSENRGECRPCSTIRPEVPRRCCEQDPEGYRWEVVEGSLKPLRACRYVGRIWFEAELPKLLQERFDTAA